MMKDTEYLEEAQSYAEQNSTCAKVKVGSIILTYGGFGPKFLGCNHGCSNCKENGCRRIKLYGNASKEHRLPSDCDALHSEVDAITQAAKKGVKVEGAIMYVTRYPCEACARAIASAGIKKVVYGRKEDISDYTRQILEAGNVIVEKVEWEREDNNE